MTNFEQFYITWYSRAIYFAREYILSESDAENIVQDVFLHLYEHCDRLDAYTNLTAYLFTSIKNKCLDYLRKRVNEQEAVAEMQSEFDMALRMKYDSLEILNTNFPDETGIEERLKQALQKLPERCRSIFVMNKLEGKKTTANSLRTANFHQYRRITNGHCIQKITRGIKRLPASTSFFICSSLIFFIFFWRILSLPSFTIQNR